MKNNRPYLLAIILMILMSVGKCIAQEPHAGVFEMIKAHNIKHPEIVYHQALLESGNFNPNLNSSWVHYNNPFGFRLSSQITSTNSKGYITFDNLEHAVEYYKSYQDKYYTGGDYYQFLINMGYAQSPNYITNLKQF